MSTGVFISYAGQDELKVDDIYDRLRSERTKCWAACKDVRPGDGFVAEIENAIRGCELMVVLVSANAIGSIYVLREVETAAHFGKTIIPFFLEDIELENGFRLLLGEIHAIKSFTLTWEYRLGLVAEAIRRHLAVEEAA